MSETSSSSPAVAGDDSGAISAIPLRHWGRWVWAVALVAIIGSIFYSFSQVLDLDTIGEYLFSPVILEGLRTTIIISLLAQFIGIVLGVFFAVMRLSKNPVSSTAANLYIWFFRGTPVLVQLLFWFAAVPLVYSRFVIGIPFTDIVFFERPMVVFMSSFMAALMGLGFNEGAYMAEIVRAGIGSVDEGQTEAAKALGMRPAQTMRRIVLPQAMRVIIPPTGNEFISMLKTSSLASVVLLAELLRSAQNIYSTNFKTLELLVVVSIWYLTLTTIASIGQFYLERHYSKGSSRNLPSSPWAVVRAHLKKRRPGALQ